MRLTALGGRGRVRRALFALLLLADEVAIVGAALLTLSVFRIQVPLGVLLTIVGTLVLVAYLTFRWLKPMDRRPYAGLASMLGMTGEVISTLNPRGQVRVAGEIWAASSSDGTIPAGKGVRIVHQEGLRLIVDRLPPPEDGES